MAVAREVVHCVDWRERVAFSSEGPAPRVLSADEKTKVVVAGLEAGQRIPPHPEGQGVFHCLEGNGWMIVDGERLPFDAGAIIVVPGGATRGVEAETRLAFLVVRVN